ncbi:MAG TPA: selenide, water dikinase SelD [Casimicrobiaceae bacterium]|nr:selenide, water dikinase SelD [Casimicrobiaceae bacterium]
MNAQDRKPLRLTQFSHGGGCGCKIAPGVLQQILAGSAAGFVPPELLVGIETSDDAAVYRINDSQVIIATTDFFMPIVDDPYDFGAIAATNAISDIYAMGGTPLFALALVAMPVKDLPIETIRRIVAGGEMICARARIPIAGGHTIDSVEPIYGLAVIGTGNPAHIKRNVGAQPGDALILGKPLGVGIYSAALRKDALAPAAYRTLIDNTTQLNTPGIELARLPAVHAMTDVTGFGLLGHLLEMCRASHAGASIDFARIPLLPDALDLAKRGHVTGASRRNFDGYGSQVTIAPEHGEIARALLTDPQTSGGLLVACEIAYTDEVLQIFRSKGFENAATIGVVANGPPHVNVS